MYYEKQQFNQKILNVCKCKSLNALIFKLYMAPEYLI